MARWRLIAFPIVLSGLFALVASDSWHGDPFGRLGRGLQGVSVILRAAYVEPVGYFQSVLLVFGLGVLISGFFLIQPSKEAPREHVSEPRPGTLAYQVANRIGVDDGPDVTSAATPANSAPQRPGFGKRRSPPAYDTGNEEAAQNAFTMLKTRGFDWYLSEYGFEGRWKDAQVGLRTLGHRKLASLLGEAGACFDLSEAERTSYDTGELPPDSAAAYMAAMRGFDGRKRSLLGN